MPKALIPIFLIIVVDILGMAIIFPLLPFYAEHLGASPTEVGLLVSIYALFQLFGGPMLGRMSDQMGRKPLLIVSQVGTLAGFALLAWAGNLWLVFLSRAIDGFTAGNISLAQAYISDVTKPEQRTRSFALIGVAFGVGFLLGPALSGFLSQYSYQAPIFAAMGLSAASICATWLLLPVTRSAAEAPRRFTILEWRVYAAFFRRPSLGPLLWQFSAFAFAFTLFMSGFALFAERRFTFNGHPYGPREVGYIYAYVGALGILFQGGLIGRFGRWLGDRGLVRSGFIIGTASFVALAWTFRLIPLLVVCVTIAYATSVLRPALTSLITQMASRSEQGSVLGLTQSLQAISQIAAPIVGGILIDHNLLWLWACAAALSLFAGLLVRSGGSGIPGEERETVLRDQSGP